MSKYQRVKVSESFLLVISEHENEYDYENESLLLRKPDIWLNINY